MGESGESILAHEQARSKPMTGHSRGAARETVKLLTEAPCRAVLHSYTGPADVADGPLAGGLWFSVNTAMTRSARSRELIARLPANPVSTPGES